MVGTTQRPGARAQRAEWRKLFTFIAHHYLKVLEKAIILSINMAAFVACFKNMNTTLIGVCSCTLLPPKKHKLINCGNEIKRRTYPYCYKRNVIKEIMPEKFLEKIKFGRNTKSDMNICKISALVIFKMPRSPLTRG